MMPARSQAHPAGRARARGFPPLRVPALAALLFAGGWVAAVAPAAAQVFWSDRPPYEARVTTDSPEYCTKLLDRIVRERARVEAPVRQADMLAAEGRRMCDRGHIRPGIARLRRALLLLEKAE